MRLKRFTGHGKVLSAALLAGALCFVPGIAKSETAIGVLTPLTGKPALLGKQIEFGAKLAVDKLKAADKYGDIRLEVRDSACDAVTAKSASHQLLKRKVQIVIGPLCGKALEAALDVLSPAGVPVIAPFARSSQLDRGRKEKGWLSYTLASNSKAEPENIARILLERWKGVPYAIADDGSIYGRGLADDLRIIADASGQKPVALANYRPLQTNQVAMLRRLMKNGIKALFIGGDAADIAQIARDARKLGLDIEIVGGESMILLPYVDDAAGIPEGLMAILPIDPALVPEAGSLADNLRKENIDPEGALLPGYAMVQIAAKAIANDNLKLEGQAFPTIMGTISFDSNGRASAYSYQLHVWKDGQMKPLGGF